MTMLAYNLKHVLELVPEAIPMVKQASVGEASPINSRDSVLASALAISYSRDIAGTVPDLYEMEKVAQAVDAYGLKSEVASFEALMTSRAREKSLEKVANSKETYLTKQASLTGDLAGLVDLEIVASKAEALHKQASDLGFTDVLSPEVIRYSGKGLLNKEAAINCLSFRFNVTGNEEFTKLASALQETKTVSEDLNRKLCQRVTQLDKQAGLHFKGLDFYKETQFTKVAELKSCLNIKLAGKMVPYESFERLGKDNISTYIGKDVAAEMDRGPDNFKEVVETLPLDMQKALARLIK